MNFHLKVWRQKDTNAPGTLEEYEAENIPAGASFLEMLDIVNAGLTRKNIEPIQLFAHHQWHPTRQRPWNDLPALHAEISRRRDDHHRAVPR
jgi:hypothetical protein